MNILFIPFMHEKLNSIERMCITWAASDDLYVVAIWQNNVRDFCENFLTAELATIAHYIKFYIF